MNVHIGSLFNHSCDPNTVRVNVGAATVLVAARSIDAGEEVTAIYRMHHSEIGSEQRKTWLQKNFFFWCGCHACEDGYSTYDLLPGEVRQFRLLSNLQHTLYTTRVYVH